MRRLEGLAAGTLALLMTGPAFGDCSITGRVIEGNLFIADAEIATALGSAAPVPRGRSDGDGRFTITVMPLPRDMRTLKLIISKQGHEPGGRILEKKDDGCPASPMEPVALGPQMLGGAATNGGRATGENVCARRSTLGLTVFIAPYRFYGSGADQTADRLNRDLPQIVHHRILSFKSSLAGVASYPDFSVETICLPLTAAEGERARSIGQSLNALGIIAGAGELRNDQGKQVIGLVSVFRIIPAYRTYVGEPLSIEDTIPSEGLFPSRVAEGMRDLWGKQVVLAYALQQMANLPASPDQAEIAKLNALIVSLRKTMTADDPLLSQVQQVYALLLERKAGQ